jgi:hypothetical protein
MSLTASRGMMDAGRWTTVATTVAEHLGAVEDAIKSHHSLPPAPVGALDAAEQFFGYVLLALDQSPNTPGATPQDIGRSSTPTMAGISSLSIAVTVMRRAQGDVSSVNLQKVREQVNAFTRTLKALKEHQADKVRTVELSELMDFFNALGRAGRIERAATIAMHERPNV